MAADFPAYPLFHNLFQNNDELKITQTKTEIVASLPLADQTLVWSAKQVGVDKFDVVFPVFCLKNLGLDDDFLLGAMNGKASFTQEDLEILSEDFESEAKAFNSWFSILSLFCYSVEAATGKKPSVSSKRNEPFAVQLHLEFNYRRRWFFDITYGFQENTFSFVMSYEALKEAMAWASVKRLLPYFEPQKIARATDALSDEDIDTEISVRSFSSFFKDFKYFLSHFDAEMEEAD